MRFPFRAPAISYAPPPADTPYRRAQAEWDARMGSAVLSTRSWRRIAFAGLLLAAGLGAALVGRGGVDVAVLDPVDAAGLRPEPRELA